MYPDDDLNVEEMMEAEAQHTMNYLKEKSLVKSEDSALRQATEQAGFLAETILQSRFDEQEKAVFAKVIRQFNELWWEMGVQTWSSMKYRGVTCLKPPTDLWVYQELIYTLRPNVIIETGTFAGGSALYMRDVIKNIGDLDCQVVTIDCDITKLHETFKVACYDDEIKFIYGESTEQDTVDAVKALVGPNDRVMVILDSDHSYENVTKELNTYAPMVTKGSCLIVEDTSNTASARQANDDWYFDHRKEFKRDIMCEKLMLTFNRDGYYERIV